MNQATGVEVKGLTVRYGRHHALDDVTVSIPPGTSAALVGPNGSGKTTLIKALCGLLPTDAATVTVPSPVALVPQHAGSGHWLPLTVAEVVAMGRYGERGLLGRLRDADRRAIDAAARRMAIDDHWNRALSELSGGLRQRALVAQALAGEPSLLVMDEPITGLDLPSQERILATIDSETDAGTTVVISTHHLDEARHCDQVILLNRHLVAAGSPDDVLQPEPLRAAFGARVLGDHDDHDHDDTMLLLDDHGHSH